MLLSLRRREWEFLPIWPSAGLNGAMQIIGLGARSRTLGEHCEKELGNESLVLKIVSSLNLYKI